MSSIRIETEDHPHSIPREFEVNFAFDALDTSSELHRERRLILKGKTSEGVTLTVRLDESDARHIGRLINATASLRDLLDAGPSTYTKREADRAPDPEKMIPKTKKERARIAKIDKARRGH